jgi:hypothetical protein
LFIKTFVGNDAVFRNAFTAGNVTRYDDTSFYPMMMSVWLLLGEAGRGDRRKLLVSSTTTMNAGTMKAVFGGSDANKIAATKRWASLVLANPAPTAAAVMSSMAAFVVNDAFDDGQAAPLNGAIDATWHAFLTAAVAEHDELCAEGTLNRRAVIRACLKAGATAAGLGDGSVVEQPLFQTEAVFAAERAAQAAAIIAAAAAEEEAAAAAEPAADADVSDDDDLFAGGGNLASSAAAVSLNLASVTATSAAANTAASASAAAASLGGNSGHGGVYDADSASCASSVASPQANMDADESSVDPNAHLDEMSLAIALSFASAATEAAKRLGAAAHGAREERSSVGRVATARCQRCGVAAAPAAGSAPVAAPLLAPAAAPAAPAVSSPVADSFCNSCMKNGTAVVQVLQPDGAATLTVRLLLELDTTSARASDIIAAVLAQHAAAVAYAPPGALQLWVGLRPAAASTAAATAAAAPAAATAAAAPAAAAAAARWRPAPCTQMLLLDLPLLVTCGDDTSPVPNAVPPEQAGMPPPPPALPAPPHLKAAAAALVVSSADGNLADARGVRVNGMPRVGNTCWALALLQSIAAAAPMRDAALAAAPAAGTLGFATVNALRAQLLARVALASQGVGHGGGDGAQQPPPPHDTAPPAAAAATAASVPPAAPVAASAAAAPTATASAALAAPAAQPPPSRVLDASSLVAAIRADFSALEGPGMQCAMEAWTCLVGSEAGAALAYAATVSCDTVTACPHCKAVQPAQHDGAPGREDSTAVILDLPARRARIHPVTVAAVLARVRPTDANTATRPCANCQTDMRPDSGACISGATGKVLVLQAPRWRAAAGAGASKMLTTLLAPLTLHVGGIDWTLSSMLCHSGHSIFAGHYTTLVLAGGRVVLANDDRVIDAVYGVDYTVEYIGHTYSKPHINARAARDPFMLFYVRNDAAAEACAMAVASAEFTRATTASRAAAAAPAAAAAAPPPALPRQLTPAPPTLRVSTAAAAAVSRPVPSASASPSAAASPGAKRLRAPAAPAPLAAAAPPPPRCARC